MIKGGGESEGKGEEERVRKGRRDKERKGEILLDFIALTNRENRSLVHTKFYSITHLEMNEEREEER